MFQQASAEFRHHLNEYGQSESRRRSTWTLIRVTARLNMRLSGVPLLVACSLSVLFSQSYLDQDLLKMAREGQDALVRTLLNSGADINARDESGRTALMLAALGGHVATVTSLLDAGADVEAKDDDGKTAHGLASEKGQNEIVQVLGIDPKERRLWESYMEAGLRAFYEANYSEADGQFVAALSEAEKWGDQNLRLAGSLNNLALVYGAQGRYAEAEPLYLRALAIEEEVLGPEHPHVATNLDNLAVLYLTQGKYAEAEPLHQRALTIRETVLGPEHPDVANSLNNLAALYEKQGNYAEAEPLYQRALAIQEKALGPEHRDVGTSLNNLALLYEHQREYGQAEPLYRRSLAIREKALGPEHPAVAKPQRPGVAVPLSGQVR